MALIDYLLHHTRGTPMLSVIASPQPHLFKHLQQQLDAKNPQDEGFVMRLADSRALHSLLQVLTADQRQRLLLPGMQWWYWKMDGELTQVEGAQTEHANEAQTGPYGFSAEQIDHMAALSQPSRWMRVIDQHQHHFGPLTGSPSQVCACLQAVLKREASQQLHDAAILSAFKTALLQQGLLILNLKQGVAHE